MAKTLQANQIADAIITAPSVRIEAINAFTSGSQSYNGVSYAAIDTNLTGVQFTVPVAGDYWFTIRHQIYNSSSGCDGRLKAVFDAGGFGGFSEQVFTDDSGASLFFNCGSVRVGTSHVVGPVALAAGTHTLSLEWKFVAGAGSMVSDTATSWTVYGTLLSGSGAGGEITDKVSLTSDHTGIGSTFVDITDGTNKLELSIAGRAGESVLVCLRATATTSTTASAWSQLLLDGTPIDESIRASYANWGTNIDIVVPVEFSESGTKVITAQARVSAGTLTIEGDSTRGVSSLYVMRFRGGLVPVQQGGTAVLDMPRAYNFLGAAVEDNDGVADIHIGASAPGSRIYVSDGGPNSAIVLGATYGKIMPEDESSMSFECPFQGLYKITFGCTFTCTTSNTTAITKVVFDEGTGSEVTVGDNDQWQIRVTTGGDYEFVSYVGEVNLSAGSHTVTAYAKETSGSAMEISPGVTGPFLELIAVTGSGAGGVLVDSKEKTANQGSLSAATWNVISELSHNITVSADEELSLEYMVIITSTSNTTAALAYRVDGGGWIQLEAASDEGTRWNALSGSKALTLSAGSYLIEFGEYHDFGTGTVFGSNSYATLNWTSRTAIRQYRGGHVPVQENGVTKTSTPAAFNFTGDNVSVTNVGGAANIEFNGIAGGLKTEQASLAADFTTPSTSFADVDNGGGDALTVDVTVAQNEKILIFLEGYAIHTGGANRIDVQFDISGTVIPTTGLFAESGSSGYSFALGSVSPVLSPALSAGSKTVKVQTKVSSNSVAWKQGARLVVAQVRGGYVKPENAPVFERDGSDTSLINATAAIGASSEMRLLFNDGVRRTATLPLVCDIDVDGIGGRDTGDATAESVGDLYHLYAVESDVDSTKAKLVLSKDAVPGTSGPPSFSVYRYLWTVRIESIGPVVIESFFMSEEGWYEPVAKNLTAYSIESGTAASPGTTGSWVDKTSTLQALIPESADSIEVHGFMSSTSQQAYIAADASPSWTPAIAQPRTQLFLQVVSAAQYSEKVIRLACPSRELSVWYGTSTSTTWTIQLEAYRNALYPGAKEAQAQAPLNLDTVQNETSNKTLVSGDRNKTLSNSGATGQVDFTLPSAAVGLRFTFAVLAAQILRVVTDSTADNIRIAGSITAGASRYVESNTVGNTVSFLAVSNDLWIAVASHGTWTFST